MSTKPSGQDHLVGGALSDSISGGDGHDFLEGHVFSVGPFGSTDGERDDLFGGDGYDGYRLGRELVGQTTDFSSVMGGFVADDAFDYSMFDDADWINDSDGLGNIIHRSPDYADLDLWGSLWTVFDNFDAIPVDFFTTSDVYILSEVYGEYYNDETEEHEFGQYPVLDSGYEKNLIATMDDGNLYIFEMERDGETSYLPVGVVEDYTMSNISYIPSDLEMYFV